MLSRIFRLSSYWKSAVGGKIADEINGLFEVFCDGFYVGVEVFCVAFVVFIVILDDRA